MPPKGANAKKESGRAKKAENEVKKKEAAAAEQERQEAKKWTEGSKVDKQADARAKQEAAAARKAEAARLLAEEEANIGSSKPKVAKGPKPVKKATLPTETSTEAPQTSGKGKGKATEPEPEPEAPVAGTSIDGMVESFSASNLDDALDLLENVVNVKTDKAGVGSAANSLERHPERRFKAAFEAYMERELPELRKDRPGLRLQQYKDLLFKSFQKSPDNPFNQTVVAYDASKEEKIEALKKRQEEVQERLREKKGLDIS
ncbi:hypothetical protein FRC17_001690 [Serendipita sp. 399]|nr:hypothetical protein FRC17_001690 [Serendipita sp. 399]